MVQTTKRTLLVIGGCISLALGVIGAFLPLLPTVPFILLAGFCFARSSEKLHLWLTTHPWFGPIIRDFEAGNGIPRRVKVRAISLLWLSLGLSAWITARPELWALLGFIGICTSTYLWRLPEPPSDSASNPEQT